MKNIRSLVGIGALGVALTAGIASVPSWLGQHKAADLAGQKAVAEAGTGPTPGVYFQNEGSLSGWSKVYTQKRGVIRNVSSPSYKGGTAIEAKQTYINQTGGYHAESIRAGAQSVGQDRYYGQAIYIAPNWKFFNQNVTFQQFSPENPEGPWLLMFIQDNKIRFGGSGGITGTVGDIANLRGTWIRIVIRLKLAAAGGAVEVWLNGKKTVSQTGKILPKTSKTIRWSSGIYCNQWRTEKPTGDSTLSVFHDHYRIASTYALAEPANW